MKRFYLLAALLLSLPFMTLCEAHGHKEIRTVAILGDSYSTFDGYIPEGNACWYFTTPQGDNDVVKVEDTWWHQFCEDGGYELLMNDSYSGSTICNTGYDKADYSDRSFITRMKNVAAINPDLILVFGGTNDSWADSPVGELMYGGWTAEDLYKTLPACCHMLDYLAAEAPQSHIVFIINSELKYEIVAGIMDACRHYEADFILLKDIEKAWGHPSVKGMAQINEQLSAFVAGLK